MRPTKSMIYALVLAQILLLSLAACSGKNSTSSNIFPNIDNADIPDILEKNVGTLCNTYFTSFGASDNKDYKTFLAVTFEETSETDYAALMEHYQSASTGTDKSRLLLFDWGRLQATPDNASITINAYIK